MATTIKGRKVEQKVVYEIEYNEGKSHGLGWINPTHNDAKMVDILCASGGVTYQYISDVKFLRRYR